GYTNQTRTPIAVSWVGFGGVVAVEGGGAAKVMCGCGGEDGGGDEVMEVAVCVTPPDGAWTEYMSEGVTS
ncbi:hypothetical protein Tco_0074545, partial [Tanacetum coccineum]